MLTKIKQFVKRNYLVISAIIISTMLIVAGINIANMPPDQGLAITNATGTIVICLNIFLFCWVLFILFSQQIINYTITRALQLVMAVGAFMLTFEYVMSIVFKINLNIYGSIFWNDCGCILLTYAVIHFCVAPFVGRVIKMLKNKKSE